MQWKKQLSRDISLIDVASNLISSYRRLESVTTPNRVLSCRSNAVRCAFTIATILREILAKKLKIDNGYDKNGEDHTTFYVLSMAVFEPPPSKQKELLPNAILKVTEQEYKARCSLSGDNEASSDEQGNAI